MRLRLMMMPVCAIALAGCVGPLVAIEDTARLSPHASQLPVVVSVPTDALPLAEIEATSCKNKAWSPPATREDALAQLRIRAERYGADGLAGLTYEDRSTTLMPNCWASVRASAIAFRRAPPPNQ